MLLKTSIKQTHPQGKLLTGSRNLRRKSSLQKKSKTSFSGNAFLDHSSTEIGMSLRNRLVFLRGYHQDHIFKNKGTQGRVGTQGNVEISDKSSVGDVIEWAKKTLNLNDEELETLSDQKIDGKALLSLSRDDLLELNFKMGTRKALMSEIQKLKFQEWMNKITSGQLSEKDLTVIKDSSYFVKRGFSQDHADSLMLEIQELRPSKDSILNEDTEEKNYIKIFDQLKTEKVEVYDPPAIFDEEKTRSRLGSFYKKPLPFTNDVIDMRLVDLPVTPTESEKLIKLFAGREEKHAILINKSGTGKTRVLFDVARKYFTVFFECGTVEESQMQPGTDILFRLMLDEIKEKSEQLSPIQFRLFVKKRISLEVVSRLLYLRLLYDYFKQKGRELTPEIYLSSQLNGAKKTIERIQRILRNETALRLTDLLNICLRELEKDVLINQGRIIFAVDEASAGYKFLSEKGIWKSPNTGKNRGLLTPFIQYISNLTHGACTLYAGTSLSVGVGDTIQSDIGKIGLTTVETELPFLDMKDVLLRLNMWLELSDIPNLDAVLTEDITGRCRFVSMLPHHIIVARETYPNLTKTNLLRTAEESMIDHSRQKLTERLSSSLSSRESELSKRPDEREILDSLYLGIKFSNGIVQVKYDDKLVDVGIASLGKIGNRYFSRIREPLSKQVYVKSYEEIFGKDYYLDLLSSRVLDSKDGSEKGKPFEKICAGLISEFQKNQTIWVFLTSLFPELKNHENDIPYWTRTSNILIDSIGNCEGLGAPEDVKVIRGMMNGVIKNTALLPGNTMRPDLFTLNLEKNIKIDTKTDIDGRDYWSLAGSFKLRNSELPEVDNDFRSTDIEKFYYTKDGTRIYATKIRAEFDKVLSGKTRTGSLRIHIILPDISHDPKGAKKIIDGVFVQGQDIIIYINILRFPRITSNTKLVEKLIEITKKN